MINFDAHAETGDIEMRIEWCHGKPMPQDS